MSDKNILIKRNSGFYESGYNEQSVITNDFFQSKFFIYYTNKLVKEYLIVSNLDMDMLPLYRFDTVIENGYTVIVPSFG